MRILSCLFSRVPRGTQGAGVLVAPVWLINGSSFGVLYLSRNYFRASRKDKSICQAGSIRRRSYRAGCIPLQCEREDEK